MPHLIVDIAFALDGSRNFFAEDLPKSFPKPMHGDPRRPFAHAKRCRKGGIRRRVGAHFESRFERGKFRGACVLLELRSKTGKCTIEQRKRPSLVERGFCGPTFGLVLGLKKSFGSNDVEWDECLPPAAFPAVRMIPLIRQEAFERHQQELSKASFFSIGVAERLLCQKVREKSLREIFGIMGWVTAPARIGVNRLPVSAA
jgi:hypothetical protein